MEGQSLAPTNPQLTYQVFVDGCLIYEGEDWRQPFMDAAKDPKNGKIVLTIDGKPHWTMGPYLSVSIP